MAIIKQLLSTDNGYEICNHKCTLDLIDKSCSIKREVNRYFKLNIFDDDEILRYSMTFDDTQFIKKEIYFDKIDVIERYDVDLYSTCMFYLKLSKYGEDSKWIV